MRIILLCSAHRGYLLLKKLINLSQGKDIIVFSFREEPWEPPFFNKICDLALKSKAQFYEAKNIGSKKWLKFWESTSADLMLASGWRFMIPAHVYQKPTKGTFVFHDSLLPEYRGFAPTNWAIINGERKTGVSLFKITAEVDSGDLVDQIPVAIDLQDTVATVVERLTNAYLELLEKNYINLINGSAILYPQDHTEATYTCRRLPEDNEINWADSTMKIYNLIRAVGKPYTGAFSYFGDQKIVIWSADLIRQKRQYVGRIAGKIVEIIPELGTVVLTGDGDLLLKKIQIVGKSEICAADVFTKIGMKIGESN